MFKKKNPQIIQLSGEIDMSITPNETRIAPITGDPWIDFGYWLEATSFMAKHAMEAQGWDEASIKAYMQDYFDKAMNDYTVSS